MGELFVKRDPVIFVVVALAISLMLVFAYKVTGKQPSEANGPTGAGKPAPEFALQSLDGKTVHLSDFRGKAVVVNFWATWCQPCRVEMPWFVELQKQYGSDGLQILGINADEDTSADDLGKFAKGMGVNYPVLMGKEEVEQAYEGREIERPEHWGGYRLQAERIEFWKGRPGRLHDRILYERQVDGSWSITRLAP